MAAQRRRRLSRSGEFDRVYRDGSSHATRYLVLYSFPRNALNVYVGQQMDVFIQAAPISGIATAPTTQTNHQQ